MPNPYGTVTYMQENLTRSRGVGSVNGSGLPPIYINTCMIATRIAVAAGSLKRLVEKNVDVT